MNILQTFLSEFKVHWTQLTASGPVVASFDAFQNSHFDFAAFALSIMCGVRSATQISHFQEPDPVSPAQLAATDSRAVSDLLPIYLKEKDWHHVCWSRHLFSASDSSFSLCPWC